eukprot:8979918-Pyramimonas_sp.AAC.1
MSDLALHFTNQLTRRLTYRLYTQQSCSIDTVLGLIQTYAHLRRGPLEFPRHGRRFSGEW